MDQITERRKDFENHALRHIEILYRTALYITDNVSDARTIVLESLVKAYRDWHKREGNPDCRVWLFTIMVNALRNGNWLACRQSVASGNIAEFKNYLMHMHMRSANPSSPGNLDQTPITPISKAATKKAVRDLPADIRLIVVLSLLDSFSYREIGEIADINVNTVRAQIFRGRRLMKRSLADAARYAGTYELSMGGVGNRRSN